MKVSLFYRIVIGFVAAFFLIITFGILNFISTNQISRQYRELEYSKNIVILLENTSSAAKDIQRAHRGYMLTKDKVFLTPYHDALERISPINSRLRELIRRDAEQMKLHRTIVNLLNAKIELTESGLFKEAISRDSLLINIRRGKTIIDSLNTTVATMEQKEIEKQRLLNVEISELVRINTAIITTSIISFVLILSYGLAQLYRILLQRKKLYHEIQGKSREIHDANEELTLLNEELNSSYSQMKETLGKIEMMRSEADIREKQLTHAQHLSNTGSFVYDLAKGAFSFSSSYAKIFEIQPGESFVTFQDFLNKVHPEDVDNLKNNFQSLERLSSYGPIEYRLLVNGKLKYIIASAQIVDEIKAIVGSVMDVTAQKDTEHKLRDVNARLQRSYEDLESYNYSISHDLKAPVRSIIMYANLFFENDKRHLGPEETKWMEVILKKAKHINDLIEGLLQLSKYGAGSLRMREVDLNELAQEVIFDQRHQFPHSEKILFDVKPMPIIRADPSLIRQVFANIVSNAIKFSININHPKITISSRTLEDKIQISIKDNGVGFDPERAADLFAVFKRLHAPKEYSGSGVGLAIVKRIIESHAGEIWAVSDGKNGAEFIFTLPF